MEQSVQDASGVGTEGTSLEVQALTSDVTWQEGRPAGGCIALPHGTGEGEADLWHMKHAFV